MKKIWREEIDYYRLPTLTDELVAFAEEKLNITLPQSYINLLKEQNGGYIHYNAFPSNVPTSWVDDHVQVEYILGIGEEEGILQSEYFIQEWDLPKNIVLFSGDGHSWLAFDYRYTKQEPPIIYIDVDYEQVIELAQNFTTFLNRLYIAEVEVDDAPFVPFEINLTIAEVEAALASNQEQQIILGLNYLHENTRGNEQLIENKIITLLQHHNIEIKQLAANFGLHFYDSGIFSPKGVEKMVSIIRQDEEIAYYAENRFGEHA
ncbi:SMI1/KNR4 family protein [Lysinibacillus sp. KU-BSD001]|uniref:SMI1/KNR4 family protein n=1 Tax=Lysinibacillus sp. KU-BSD001 TaxID=3141328 RepID=UPI0036E06915